MNRKYNKFMSRRWWIILFCIICVAYIVIRDLADMAGIGAILAGAIVAYVGVESYNKPKFNQSESTGVKGGYDDL